MRSPTPAVRRALDRRSTWTFPAVAGVIVGMLIASLTTRLASHAPTQVTAGGLSSGGLTATPETVGGTPHAGVSARGAASEAAGPVDTGSPAAGSRAAGSPAAGGQAAGSPAGVAPGGPLTASDVGVSVTTIKVGFVLLDLGGASSLGAAVPGFDPKVQQKEWQTYVDELNRAGGIYGRKLQPYYVKADPVDTNSQRQACLQLTQDDKVFLVVNMASALGTSELCVTAENRTLEISAEIDPTDYYQRAPGLLIDSQQHGNRWFADWVLGLQHIGKLRGRTLDILTDQDRADVMVAQGLVPTLRRLGYSVAYLADVSGDPERGPSEIPPQMQQMRLKGVDAVFLATTFVNATAFVNDADKQQWRPQYFTSDWSGDDVGTLLGGMPPSFDGAIGMTDYGFPATRTHPEPASAAGCIRRWNALTGSNLSPSDEQNYSNVANICLTVDLIKQGLNGAGRYLTRMAVSSAVQALGPFDWGGLGGAFRSGKTDWADVMRAMVWGTPPGSPNGQNCNPNGSKCWNEDGPSFRPES